MPEMTSQYRTHKRALSGLVALVFMTSGIGLMVGAPAFANSDTSDPPLVASASLVFDAPACDAGERLGYGDITNASFSGTADGTEGPGSYNVVATADGTATFPPGDGVSPDGTTLTFAGTLAGPLDPNENPDCVPPPPPTCEEGEVLVDDECVTPPPPTCDVTAPDPLTVSWVHQYVNVAWTPNTGHFTASLKDGVNLCGSVTILVSGYDVPDSWDGNGFNPTAAPQPLVGTTKQIVLTNDVRSGEATADLPTCGNAQADAYTPPELVLVTAAGHGGQFITGGIWKISDCPPPPPDVCLTIDGVEDPDIQSTVPEGYTSDGEGNCTKDEVPPTETGVTFVVIPDSCGIEDIDALLKAAGWVEDNNPSSVGVYEKDNVFLSVDDQRDANGNGDVILTYEPKPGFVFSADVLDVGPNGQIVKTTTLTNEACPTSTTLPGTLAFTGTPWVDIMLTTALGLVAVGMTSFLGVKLGWFAAVAAWWRRRKMIVAPPTA